MDIEHIDWARVGAELDERGSSSLGRLLAPEDCAALVRAYDEPGLFRSRVIMARHGYGRGEYQYFAAPLPPLVQSLRTGLYPPLAAVANGWRAKLGQADGFPAAHDAYLEICRGAGQTKPTPLLLRYGEGDYNCLHQDLYGAEVFPLQVVILLSRPGEDFTGGELVLTEQRPRMQSRAEVVEFGQGEAVVFAVNERPVAGSHGAYRVKMRHGVSRLRSGRRFTLGVIFHDAA
jgi:hypothetical protein